MHMSKSEQTVKVRTGSDVTNPDLKSLIMEAFVDGTQVADILYLKDQWYVTLMTHEGMMRVTLENMLKIAHEFAKFVLHENEAMMREIHEEYRNQEE